LGDVLGRQLGEREQQRQAWLGPMAPPREPLDSMPGVHALTARAMLAELGLDMPRLGSAERLAAWAG
jgi:transposase